MIKNSIKNFSIFFIVFFFLPHTLWSNGSIVEKIKKTNTADIVPLLENAAIQVFGQGDDIIKDINPKEVEAWKKGNEELWKYIETARVQYQPYKPYKDDINALKTVQSSLIDSIVALHNNFYKGEPTKDKDAEKKKLQNLEKNIPFLITTLENVLQNTTSSMLKNTQEKQLPERVRKQVQGKEVKDVFPEIDEFLKAIAAKFSRTYNTAQGIDKAQGFGVSKFRKNAIREFPSVSFADTSTTRGIETIIERLEQALFIEFHKFRFLQKTERIAKIIKLLLIIEDIRLVDTKLKTTPFMWGVVLNTADRFSVILYAQALRFQGIVSQLQKSLASGKYKL